MFVSRVFEEYIHFISAKSVHRKVRQSWFECSDSKVEATDQIRAHAKLEVAERSLVESKLMPEDYGFKMLQP